MNITSAPRFSALTPALQRAMNGPTVKLDPMTMEQQFAILENPDTTPEMKASIENDFAQQLGELSERLDFFVNQKGLPSGMRENFIKEEKAKVQVYWDRIANSTQYTPTENGPVEKVLLKIVKLLKVQ